MGSMVSKEKVGKKKLHISEEFGKVSCSFESNCTRGWDFWEGKIIIELARKFSVSILVSLTPG